VKSDQRRQLVLPTHDGARGTAMHPRRVNGSVSRAQPRRNA